MARGTSKKKVQPATQSKERAPQAKESVPKAGEERRVPALRPSTWDPALLSGSPFAVLRRFTEEMDRLFDDFARGFGWPSMGRSFFEDRPFRRLESAMTTPSMRVNVAETDSAYEIEAELPGLDQKDIELKVSDGVMTLSGERKAEQEERKKDYHLMERSYGSFRRSFAPGLARPAGPRRQLVERFLPRILAAVALLD